MSAAERSCDCGGPLHYLDAEAEASVQQLVGQLGPLITIELGRHAWRVPRHYVALHGLAAAELPELAARYGWERVY